MKIIKFKLRYLIELPLELSIEQIRKFPTNSSYLYRQKQEIITYKFDPCKNLNEKEYVKFLKQHFIELYKPISIEVIE